MKKGSSKSKPAAKRGLKDLPPKKTSDTKGGTNVLSSANVMANVHEMKKALIGNFPR